MDNLDYMLIVEISLLCFIKLYAYIMDFALKRDFCSFKCKFVEEGKEIGNFYKNSKILNFTLHKYKRIFDKIFRAR